MPSSGTENCFYFSWGRLFSSVQSLSHVQLFATPWTAACQASLSITNSWSLPKFMSIESVMPSSHLILCHPLLLNESARLIRWPKVFEVSAWTSVLPVNTQDWSPLGWTGWILKAIRKVLKQIKQKFFSVLLVNKSRVIYLSLNSRCLGSKSVFLPSVSLSKL